MTANITTPPPITHGFEPAGSKKMQAKADPKLSLAPTSTDKTIVARQIQGGTVQQSDLPRSHVRQSPDGRTVLVSLNETGVKTENKLPLNSSAKVQVGAQMETLATVKNPYIKTS
tara:strand:- start:42 stop:386 length:345 start_codon:yes stop_codon:yes gene_type:complete